MKKSRLFFAAFVVFFSLAAIAQESTQKTIISATLRSSVNNEVIPFATVSIKERQEKTFSDSKGNIRFSIPAILPVTLIVSSIGYETKEVVWNKSLGEASISLSPSATIQEEVVVLPTGTLSSALLAPVTVERMSLKAIVNSAAPNFYSGISNLKGVDVTTSGIMFNTISTRGFNGSGNLRMNQYLDGMDNQAPGLNFSVGNFLGMSELDVESVELLPGASSALHGSGGLNGVLLMKSKNPFKYSGFSAQVKEGVMHVNDDNQKRSPYHDFSIRWAKSFNNKFAFKINAQYIGADDWQASDMSNLSRTNLISKPKAGDRKSDPNYDGVNVYGDEVNVDMYSTNEAILSQVVFALREAFKRDGGRYPTPAELDQIMSNHPQYKAFWLGKKFNLIPRQRVSRTGYNEKDMVDYKSYNLKISGGLYYNLTPETELSVIGYWGTGTTVYTGADRYSLKGVKMGQYKAEIKNKNSFLRAYTTQENAGDAYNTTALASYINESWKNSEKWFPEFIGNYAGARLMGVDSVTAYSIARMKADSGRFMPGTAAFNQQHEGLSKTPISKKGARFLDKTDLWQFDGQLDLSSKVKVVDVLVGGSYKQYVLNSEGTLFSDTAGRIKIPEWGGFIQLQKAVFNEHLILTASGRYDKSKNFKGRITPRIAALVKVKEVHNLRVSYQTAYRFPATQDQYINLFTGTTTLIGSLPEFASYYNFSENPPYTAGSIAKFRETSNPGDLQKGSFDELKPETVNSVEFGYKALIEKKLLIDIYTYFSRYNNFIGRVAVGQSVKPGELPTGSFNTKSFAYAQNSGETVNAKGFGAGIEYRAGSNYTFRANVASDKLYNVESDFVTFFNTPKYRFNIGAANEDVWRGFGFNVMYRWQDKVDWEGTFGTGPVPSYGTMDGMFSYRMPKVKTLIKVGASNIFNRYYSSAFGNPQVGGIYYVSVGYNVF
jgi:outer membrane receptor protein involved in Fe transport